MKYLIAVLVLMGSTAAHSQTAQCWGTPGTTTVTCQSTDSSATPGPYGYLHDAGKQQFLDAGYALGQVATAMPANKKIADIVLGVKCGEYEFMSVTYSDKSGNTVTMSGKINDADIADAKAKFPKLRIVTVACPAE